jgi:hypothetical protein
MDDHAFDGRIRMEGVLTMEIDYRTEHHRMLGTIEDAERTIRNEVLPLYAQLKDMLEPARRAGPTGGTILPVTKTQISKSSASKTNVHQVMRELRLKDD